MPIGVLVREEILLSQKFPLLHIDNFEGVLAFGFFHHRRPITQKVHCSTCLPLFDLVADRVIPEEGVTPRKEFMIRDIHPESICTAFGEI